MSLWDILEGYSNLLETFDMESTGTMVAIHQKTEQVSVLVCDDDVESKARSPPYDKTRLSSETAATHPPSNTLSLFLI